MLLDDECTERSITTVFALNKQRIAYVYVSFILLPLAKTNKRFSSAFFFFSPRLCTDTLRLPAFPQPFLSSSITSASEALCCFPLGIGERFLLQLQRFVHGNKTIVRSLRSNAMTAIVLQAITQTSARPLRFSLHATRFSY